MALTACVLVGSATLTCRPAIIVTAGEWGAPMGITISSNYYEENNIQPIRYATSSDIHPVELICTELLLNGDTWNQS
jgi:hypothetical protein